MNAFKDRRHIDTSVIKLFLDVGYREQFLKMENKRRQELREQQKVWENEGGSISHD